MNLREIVRHDLLVVRNSRLAVGVFIGLVGVTAPVFGWTASNAATEATLRGLFTTMFSVMVLVPLFALVASAFVLAIERQSGRMRFLLVLPNQRSEIVIGKVLSRGTLVNGGLLTGFLLIGVVALALGDAAWLPEIGILTLLTMLFATGYVGVAIGVSAACANQVRAVIASLSVYLVSNVIWLPMFPVSGSQVTIDLLESVLSQSPGPVVVRAVEMLNPLIAYSQSLQLLGPSFENLARSISSTNTVADPILAIGILLGWVLTPISLGYLGFRRATIE